MQHRTRLSIVTAAIFGASHLANATAIYSTGFENPAFQSGQLLAGQDGWENQIFNGGPLGLNGGISAAHASSGLQSVRVNGADLTPVAAAGYDVGSYRRFVNFDVAAAGFPVIRIEADMRLDGPQTTQTADRTTGDYFSVNLAAFSDDGDVGEMSLSSDGHVYSYSAADSYLFERPINLGQYYHLTMDLDFTTRMTTFGFDGQVVGTAPFDDSFTSNVLSRGSFVDYALDPDDLLRDRSAYNAYYDNFSISAIPEPCGAALGAIGIFGVASRSRKRRRI